MWGVHRWPVNSPHKGPVTRKMFPFDDVIMIADRWELISGATWVHKYKLPDTECKAPHCLWFDIRTQAWLPLKDQHHCEIKILHFILTRFFWWWVRAQCRWASSHCRQQWHWQWILDSSIVFLTMAFNVYTPFPRSQLKFWNNANLRVDENIQWCLCNNSIIMSLVTEIQLTEKYLELFGATRREMIAYIKC